METTTTTPMITSQQNDTYFENLKSKIRRMQMILCTLNFLPMVSYLYDSEGFILI